MACPSRLLLLAVCTALLGPALCSTAAERTEVMEKLLASGPLNLPVRPDGLGGGNTPVMVNISYSLVSIADLDTSSGRIETVGYLFLSWFDPRLVFNSSNVRAIRMETSQIWTPDIEVYYSDTVGLRNVNRKSLAVVYSNGEVNFVPQAVVPGMCELSNQSTGEFTCSMKLGSWVYNGDDLDLVLKRPGFDLIDYVSNHRWRIISTSAKRYVQYFACCVEPYVDVVFSLKVVEQD